MTGPYGSPDVWLGSNFSNLEFVSANPIGWVKEAWRFVFDVGLRWYHGRVGDLAASVTFWIVISLPALVLALLGILGPLDDLISIESVSYTHLTLPTTPYV